MEKGIEEEVDIKLDEMETRIHDLEQELKAIEKELNKARDIIYGLEQGLEKREISGYD